MNIIELTKQAEEYANNVVQSNDNDYPWGFLRYQKFAALVAAHEREECAIIVEQMNSLLSPEIAAVIRARGTT